MRTALQELAKLLPRGSCAGGAENNNSTILVSKKRTNSDSCDSSGGGSSQTNSAFNTVDTAIEYIKSLQRELMEMKSSLEQKPQQMLQEYVC
jgi:hypothetical protein